MASIALTMTVFYSIFLAYTALLLTEYCAGPFIPFGLLLSGISAIMLSQTFMSEFPFLTGTLACYYHFLKNRKSSHFWHEQISGFAAGLTLMIQPAVGLLALSPILIFQSLKIKRTVPLKLIDRIFLGGAFFSQILRHVLIYSSDTWSKTQFGKSFTEWLGALTVAFLVTFICRKIRKEPLNSSFISVSIPFLMLLFWYGPFESQFIYWIWNCTWGPLAQMTGGRVHGPGTVRFFLETFAGSLGLFNLVLLAFSALGGGYLWKAGKWKQAIQSTDSLFVMATIAALLPLVIGSMSQNGNPRYYQAGCKLLEIALVVFWAQDFLPLRELRAIALGSLSIFPLFLHLLNLTVPSGVASLPPEYRLTSNETMYKTLKTVLDPLAKYRIAVLPLSSDPLAYQDPWKLTVLALEEDVNWSFSYPNGIGFPADFSTRIQYLIKNYDYILVAPMDGQAADSFDHFSKEGQAIIEGLKKDPQQCPPLCLHRIVEVSGVSSKYALFQIKPNT